MSKLSEYYAHRKALEERAGDMADLNIHEWEQMEERILREETLPQLLQAIAPIIKEVKSSLSININYDPEGALVLSFTRNAIQSLNLVAGANAVQLTGVAEPVNESPSTQLVSKDEPAPTQSKRSKSVGFSVSFADGTVIREKKAVSTWLQALQKIGLEKICNNRKKHEAWHRVDGKDVCIVEREQTVRTSDGKSPQVPVDGFYVMTQLSNEQKVKDLKALNEFMPELGLKIAWDGDTDHNGSAGSQKPKIDEQARNYNYPIKEQYYDYLRRRIADSTARSYVSDLDHAVREFIKREVDPNADSIFSYTTSEDVALCIGILKSSPTFIAENTRKHNSMTAALNNYLNFIRSINL